MLFKDVHHLPNGISRHNKAATVLLQVAFQTVIISVIKFLMTQKSAWLMSEVAFVSTSIYTRG
jgi:hypothetical protein